MKNIKQIIGNNLRFIRYQSGLSQEKFYEQYHLNSKYFACIERGEINIGVDLLEALAKALNTTPIDLITDNPNRVIAKKRIDQKN